MRHSAHSIARARALRARASMPERVLWNLLKNRNAGPKFRRQQLIGPYTVDFFCAAAKLVIELDGSQHALTRESDTVRDAFLTGEGLRVIRLAVSNFMKCPPAHADGIARIASEREVELARSRHPSGDSPEPPAYRNGADGGRQ